MTHMQNWFYISTLSTGVFINLYKLLAKNLNSTLFWFMVWGGVVIIKFFSCYRIAITESTNHYFELIIELDTNREPISLDIILYFWCNIYKGKGPLFNMKIGYILYYVTSIFVQNETQFHHNFTFQKYQYSDFKKLNEEINFIFIIFL